MTGVLIFLFVVAVLCIIPSYEDREYARRMERHLDNIDKGIEESRARIRVEVVAYVSANRAAVAKELADTGSVMIPTFAGDFIVTREDLEG